MAYRLTPPSPSRNLNEPFARDKTFFDALLQDALAWHLAYHDGEHYNSVRLADDYCEGPAVADCDG